MELTRWRSTRGIGHRRSCPTWCASAIRPLPLTGDPGMEKTGAIHAWRKTAFVGTRELGVDGDSTTQVMAFAGKI